MTSKTKKLVLGLLVLALVMVGVGYSLPDLGGQLPQLPRTSQDFGLTLGTAQAAGVADATADGVADNVDAQTLLTALPATGGRISILTGTYAWAALANVTRAIDNVTIDGTGRGTYIDSDGVTAPFTAGGNNWVISNMRFDAPGPDMGATTGWEWRNVTVGADYYAYQTPVASTTAADWQIPSGRGATLVVAASNASNASKAQADYVAVGTNDQLTIQAAIDALPQDPTDNQVRGKVMLSEGNFNISAAIELPGAAVLEGQGIWATDVRLTAGSEDNMIEFVETPTADRSYFATIRNMRLLGDDTGTNGHGIYVAAATDSTDMIIDTVWIYKVAEDGIHLETGTYTRVFNSWIEYNGGYSINSATSDIWIDRTVVYEGLYLTGTNYRITNNRFGQYGSNPHAIHVNSASAYQFLQITGNKFVGSAEAWADTLIYWDAAGSYFGDSVISSNVFEGAKDYAIDLNDNGNIIIADNTFKTGSKGVRAYGGPGVSITNNRFLNLTGTAITYYGTYGKIEGNIIQGPGDRGIYALESSVTIVDNVIDYSTNEAIYTTDVDGIVSQNRVTRASQVGAGTKDAVWVRRTAGTPSIIVTDNYISGANAQYALRVTGYASGTVSGNHLTTGASGLVDFTGSTLRIANNDGYIASGEVRTASGSLTAGIANAIAFAWHNPEAQDILVKKVVVQITTGSVTANSVIDVGIADDAAGTNRGVEFFDDLDANDVDVNDSWVAGDGGTQTKWVAAQDSASATDGWIVGQILVADAAALVGSYYIEYVGQ